MTCLSHAVSDLIFPCSSRAVRVNSWLTNLLIVLVVGLIPYHPDVGEGERMAYSFAEVIGLISLGLFIHPTHLLEL